jgi:DNA-binding transcriptional ArsR family regulator
MGVLDAVADPVRLRIVRHLADGGSATLTELADVAGVHLNTIRAHVAALEGADVLESAQKAATGPGRPAAAYRLVDGWGLSSTDFLELAGLLAAALVRNAPDAEALRATGADWGRYLVGRPGRRDVATELPRALERLGFHAALDGGRLARPPGGRLRAGDRARRGHPRRERERPAGHRARQAPGAPELHAAPDPERVRAARPLGIVPP